MGYIKQVPLKINPFHFCILPLYLTTGIGTVWQCDLCGKIWERVNGTPAWEGREAGPEEPDIITIPRPVVAHGPQGVSTNAATARYLQAVLNKIDTGYIKVGGSNVTAAVRELLENVVRELLVIDEEKAP